MGNLIKEYGGFIVASLAVIIIVFMITLATEKYKIFSKNFVETLTGVEQVSVNGI